MKLFLKRNWTYFLATLLIFVFFVLVRLANIGLIPMFTDEAIYLRWSQIMAYDASLRYYPLVDGKQPLFMWLVTVMIRLLPSTDVLVIGRLTALLSGVIGAGAVLFATYIYSKSYKVSLFALLFYVLSPFTFFYDRFTLADSLLAAFATISFGLSFLMFEKLRMDTALLLGWSAGLGLLTKSPGLFSLINLPLFFVVFPWKERSKLTNLAKIVGLMALVIILLK